MAKENLEIEATATIKINGAAKRIIAALKVASEFAAWGNSPYQEWTIDQMVRALTGDDYEEFVRAYCDGDDGPNTYRWSEGIAP